MLAETKARELQEIQEMRISMLESTLENKDAVLMKHTEEKQQLIRDFQYNLKLIHERDKEIKQFEQIVEDLREQLTRKDRVISDLKITADKQAEKLSSMDNLLEEERCRLQKKLQEQRHQIEAYCKAKEYSVSCIRFTCSVHN